SEELHAARGAGRRHLDRDRRGARGRRRADRAAAGVQRPPRAPVRLLHARHADECERAPPRDAEPFGRADQEGTAGQHLPLHRLLEHLRGSQGGRGVSSTTIAPERVEIEAPARRWSGQNVPRKEDKRLTQGQGVFVDDVKRHGMGYLHFVRAPYAHASVVSIDTSAAESTKGVYGTLTGESVAAVP